MSGKRICDRSSRVKEIFYDERLTPGELRPPSQFHERLFFQLYTIFPDTPFFLHVALVTDNEHPTLTKCLIFNLHKPVFLSKVGPQLYVCFTSTLRRVEATETRIVCLFRPEKPRRLAMPAWAWGNTAACRYSYGRRRKMASFLVPLAADF